MAEVMDFERELRTFAKRVFDNLGGLVVSGMIYLGHHLGLYRALDGAGPLDSAALAAKAGLHERWVREWLQGQAAAGLLDYDGAGGFSLSPVAALVLANENSPAFAGGAFAALPYQLTVLEPLRHAFAISISATPVPQPTSAATAPASSLATTPSSCGRAIGTSIVRNHGASMPSMPRAPS